MRNDFAARQIRRYLSIAERTVLGLGMGLLIFVVDRQMHRRRRRAKAA
jgi:hypothetical protein